MLTASQPSTLPRRVEPRRLANQGVVLEGDIAPDQCERLSEAVLEIEAPVKALLSFAVNERGHRAVSGSAFATVSVECHRCLEPMQVSLKAELDVEIVWSDEAARKVPRDCDPWVVEEDSADIIALVEEELLLALPIVTYHPEEECAIATGYSVGDKQEPEQPSRKNPFEILEQLKH